MMNPKQHRIRGITEVYEEDPSVCLVMAETMQARLISQLLSAPIVKRFLKGQNLPGEREHRYASVADFQWMVEGFSHFSTAPQS
jgi:hypothetical protein